MILLSTMPDLFTYGIWLLLDELDESKPFLAFTVHDRVYVPVSPERMHAVVDKQIDKNLIISSVLIFILNKHIKKYC